MATTQLELLQQLYDLRNEFNEQLKKVQAAPENQGEVATLQDQNRRYAYRIGHLTKAVDELIQSENHLRTENAQLKARISELEKK
ncbi:unnamed protein product (macronuclear) [Paramecium tetraurelia]|uniref:Uncharacterized protein n=1 Tax=Paramecium tetraurelia TaxID=5888 RepID=A0C6R6_PARTE|nr:uncharacterized protein GSPATT00035612001 [Paramecium tetraurelia]CAK66483.1 unnamed protein product [Paramecium tetraurelia]|eukprot:XP_001433880.1 hypothetical protein (macronuclear) [Paramecium tetraurelia strain d4-2]